MNLDEVLKYRWFYTSSGKMVFGGKSAEQNEEVISKIKKLKKKFYLMHTELPGSSFSVIDSENISEKDLKEMAIWTGCFSRAWRNGVNKTKINLFEIKDVYKTKLMKKGSFGVKKIKKNFEVKLQLFLEIQKGKIRFVPAKSNLLKIIPGKISKDDFSKKIAKKLKKSKQEVLNALPTGKFQEVK